MKTWSCQLGMMCRQLLVSNLSRTSRYDKLIWNYHKMKWNCFSTFASLLFPVIARTKKLLAWWTLTWRNIKWWEHSFFLYICHDVSSRIFLNVSRRRTLSLSLLVRTEYYVACYGFPSLRALLSRQKFRNFMPILGAWENASNAYTHYMVMN